MRTGGGGVRARSWAGAILLAGCSARQPDADVAAVRSPVGCYVVLQVEQTGGPPEDFLFPSFFSLDTLPVPDAAVPGQQVLLPRDDLSRRAGSWSWAARPDSVVVNAITPAEGWRLDLASRGATWHGRLTGWGGADSMTWALGGRRVDCPGGLVPAAH